MVRNMRLILSLCFVCLVTLLSMACSKSINRSDLSKLDASIPISPGFTNVPFPSEIAGEYTNTRKSSELTEYQISVMYPSVLGLGATLDKDNQLIDLNPTGQPSQIAWYIGKMVGFDSSKGLNPASLTIGLDSVKYSTNKKTAVAYIALSNFTKGTWEWFQVSTLGGKFINKNYPITAKNVYSSNKGNTYFILLVYQDQQLKVKTTSVTATDKLPGMPEAKLTTLTKDVNLKNQKIEFDSSSSIASTDATIIDYKWSIDGTEKAKGADVKQLIVPSDIVGTYTVSLEILDSNGLGSSTSLPYTVKQGRTDALLVYNSDEPMSVEVKDYYADMYTGRGFTAPFILGLPLGALNIDVKNSTISNYSVTRANYDSKIRIPIEDYLTNTTFNSQSLKSLIKYLILCKGVPITIADGGTDYVAGKTCSVDSELTLIFKSTEYDPTGHCTVGEMYGGKPPEAGFSTSTSPFTSFYGDNAINSSGFVPNVFKVYDFTSPTPKQTTLTYLVARLDAYDVTDVKAIIDRAKAAKDTKPADGWWICDDEPITDTKKQYDRMTAPANEVLIWKSPLAAWDYFPTILGMKFYNDASTKFVEKSFIAANFTNSSTIKVSPTPVNGDEISDAVMGYASHGVHASEDPGVLYIVNNLKDFKLKPGAVFTTYESYNGSTSKWVWDNTPATHNGQGHIADWFRIGGTGAIGNVDEPYGDACGDERFFFSRLYAGDPFIEAAYKSLMYTSWQEVVVGDPYYKLGVEIPVP